MHAGLRADQLRLGGLDRGAGSGDLRLAGRKRRLRAPYARPVIVQFLYRGGAFLGQCLRTFQPPLRGVELRLALTDEGLRCSHIGFTQRHLGLRRGHRVLGLLTHGQGFVALRFEGFQLHPSQWLARRDEIAFTYQDVFDTSGKLGSDVDFGGFDSAVTADKAFAGSAVGKLRPAPPGQRDDNRCSGNDQEFFLERG